MQYWAGEKPLHPQTITVWFGSRAGGVIGAYLFVNDSDRYRAIIIDYFWPEMEIYGLGRHVVSTRGRHKLQSTRYDRFFEEQVWWVLCQEMDPSVGAVSFVRFDAFRCFWSYVKSLVYRSKPARGRHVTEVEFHSWMFWIDFNPIIKFLKYLRWILFYFDKKLSSPYWTTKKNIYEM